MQGCKGQAFGLASQMAVAKRHRHVPCKTKVLRRILLAWRSLQFPDGVRVNVPEQRGSGCTAR